MTLALLVAGKQTGTFGTFEVTDGNVTKNRVAILNYFNDTTALVPMNARAHFTTPDEHAAFDGTLMGLSQIGVSIQYVETVAKFMDPKARFKEWLENKLTPASVGLKLTQEELAVPSAYESAKAKFVALFTAPLPKLSAGGIDLIAHFGAEYAAVIDRWRTDQGIALVSGITRIVTADQKSCNVLRVVATTGSAYKVENAFGHSITRTAFFRAYNNTIKPLWDRTPANGEIGRLTSAYAETKEKGSRYAQERTIEVYNSYVVIGCQSIPRAEIERVVAEFEKLGITQ
jgi:hypothetical protein